MSAIDLEALETEALGKLPQQGISLTYRGIEITAPPAAAWSMAVHRDLSQGYLGALDSVLGDGVFDQLLEAGMSAAGFEALMRKLGAGVPLGGSTQRSA